MAAKTRKKRKGKRVGVNDLATLMRSHRFNWGCEGDLQEGIRRVLVKASVPFKREFPLGDAGRIDFLVCGSIGLEVKVEGSNSQVVRQIQRYAERPEISEIVVVTARAVHLNLPSTLRGKRVTVVCLWEAAL
jgi:hypothetical protein